MVSYSPCIRTQMCWNMMQRRKFVIYAVTCCTCVLVYRWHVVSWPSQSQTGATSFWISWHDMTLHSPQSFSQAGSTLGVEFENIISVLVDVDCFAIWSPGECVSFLHSVSKMWMLTKVVSIPITLYFCSRSGLDCNAYVHRYNYHHVLNEFRWHGNISRKRSNYPTEDPSSAHNVRRSAYISPAVGYAGAAHFKNSYVISMSKFKYSSVLRTLTIW